MDPVQLDEHVQTAKKARIAEAHIRRAIAGLDALTDEEISVLLEPKEQHAADLC